MPRRFPSPIRRSCATELAPYLDAETPAARCSTAFVASLAAGARAHGRLPGRPQRSACSSEIGYLDPHGAGRADAGGDAGAAAPAPAATRAWLLVQIAAPSRPRRALRLRLPDPAEARRRAARRARRAPTATSPTCMPGPRSICRAPAGSGSTPTSGLFAGEGHIPLAATPHYRSAAPITGAVEPAEVEFDFEMSVDAHRTRRRASPSRSPTTPGQRSTRSARRSTRDLDGAGRAPDHGRRADLRLDRRLRERRNGTPPRSARPSAACADELIRRLRDRFAPGGLLHYGQGKWYPGESLPRWAFALYWREDGEPIWRDAGADRARGDGRRRRRIGRRGALRCRRRRAARHRRRLRACRPTRTRRTGSLKEGELPVNVDPLDSEARRSRGARPHGARVRARPRPAGRLCPAGPALERAGDGRGAGSASTGSCGAASCSWCRAIRRSASACRWARCPSAAAGLAATSCRRIRIEPRAAAARAASSSPGL